MRIIKLTVLALCLGVSVVWADDRPIYKDKNAPIEDRVEDLLPDDLAREGSAVAAALYLGYQ